MASIDIAPGGRRLFGQGALLLVGFLTGQSASFVRNAILGHLLSKGDFGVAATIAITLQLLEIISDVAVDRMILQADDGDKKRFVDTAHMVLILRGLIIGGAIWCCAPLIVDFFSVPHALWAFQFLALVPVIKGFVHLDMRRLQRQTVHGPFALVEALPQLASVLLAVPLLKILGGFEAVVYLAVIQAMSAVIISHFVAERTYGVAFGSEYIQRFFSFGWPVLLSALPLIAVYQGDRIIIGRFMGMEALAVYSASFMLAMVPGLLVSKICLSLVMPLLAEVRGQEKVFSKRFFLMSEAVVFAACGYAIFFGFLGGYTLGLAFGSDYSKYGPVLVVLSAMWGVRIMQSAPGTALMSLGITKPLLTAGVIRAAVLLPILYFASHGMPLEGVAAFGLLGELLSFVYMLRVMEKQNKGSGAGLLKRSLLYVVTLALLLIVGAHACDDEPLWTLVAQFVIASSLLGGVVAYFFREMRDEGLKLLPSRV